MNTVRVSNSLDPDQAQHFVRSNLGQTNLRRLSAEGLCFKVTETAPDFANSMDNPNCRERSGTVVERLTRDLRAAGSSLTGVTVLWSLSKAHLS